MSARTVAHLSRICRGWVSLDIAQVSQKAISRHYCHISCNLLKSALRQMRDKCFLQRKSPLGNQWVILRQIKKFPSNLRICRSSKEPGAGKGRLERPFFPLPSEVRRWPSVAHLARFCAQPHGIGISPCR